MTKRRQLLEYVRDMRASGGDTTASSVRDHFAEAGVFPTPGAAQSALKGLRARGVLGPPPGNEHKVHGTTTLYITQLGKSELDGESP